MKLSSFGYLTGQGVQGLWKNRMMTLASVAVLTASLLIVGVAVLLTENINQMVHYVEAQNEFKAFMYHEDDYLQSDGLVTTTETPQTTVDAPETDTTTDQAAGVSEIPVPTDWNAYCLEVQQEIEAIPNVESALFISKDEGIETMKDQLGDNAALLQDYMGEDNPLNDSFTIQVKDLALMEETTALVAQITGIELVSASNEVAETLTDIRQIVNVAGWALVAALVIVSLVIIMNTIRATIFNRRKELNIMRYVGATKAFIHLPFIIEGVVLGLISAGIAYLIIWQGYTYAINALIGTSTSWLNDAIESIIPFPAIAIPLAIFFVGTSVFIGVVGSAFSIRNHIKV